MHFYTKCQKKKKKTLILIKTFFLFFVYIVTVPLPQPQSIQFPMVTHSMLRVSWVPGAVDTPGHRITCSTNHGSDVKQVNSSILM